MEATVFTSLYASSLPKAKAVFSLKPAALSSSSCWLCNSQSKRITKLRLNGSNHGILRFRALFHNEETPSESDDNLSENNGFGILPADMLPFIADTDLRSNPFQEGEDDVIVTNVEEAEPEPVGRITRSRARELAKGVDLGEAEQVIIDPEEPEQAITRSRARELAKEAHGLITMARVDPEGAEQEIFNLTTLTTEPSDNH